MPVRDLGEEFLIKNDVTAAHTYKVGVKASSWSGIVNDVAVTELIGGSYSRQNLSSYIASDESGDWAFVTDEVVSFDLSSAEIEYHYLTEGEGSISSTAASSYLSNSTEGVFLSEKDLVIVDNGNQEIRSWIDDPDANNWTAYDPDTMGSGWVETTTNNPDPVGITFSSYTNAVVTERAGYLHDYDVDAFLSSNYEFRDHVHYGSKDITSEVDEVYGCAYYNGSVYVIGHQSSQPNTFILEYSAPSGYVTDGSLQTTYDITDDILVEPYDMSISPDGKVFTFGDDAGSAQLYTPTAGDLSSRTVIQDVGSIDDMRGYGLSDDGRYAFGISRDDTDAIIRREYDTNIEGWFLTVEFQASDTNDGSVQEHIIAHGGFGEEIEVTSVDTLDIQSGTIGYTVT